MTERVKTGIKGFDALVEGGLPQGFIVLLIGTPGTGKSLFSLEYAHNGAAAKENSMYITFEQNLVDIRNQAAGIGLNLAKLEKQGNLTLMEVSMKGLNAESLEKIKEEVKKRKIKRLVIDSLSTLAINAPVYSQVQDIALRDVMNYKSFFSPPILGDFVIKRFIYGFIDDLKKLGCTTIITAEAPEKGEFLTRDTVSEFQADGILLLRFDSLGGEYSRSLLVRKMRGTKCDEDVHPLEISKKGVVIHNLD